MPTLLQPDSTITKPIRDRIEDLHGESRFEVSEYNTEKTFLTRKGTLYKDRASRRLRSLKKHYLDLESSLPSFSLPINRSQGSELEDIQKLLENVSTHLERFEEFNLKPDLLTTLSDILHEYSTIMTESVAEAFARLSTEELVHAFGPSLSGGIVVKDQYQKSVDHLHSFLLEQAILDYSDHETVDKAWNLWKMLSDHISARLEVPNSAAGEERQIAFSWDKDIYHFEIEVFPTGIVEFFYLNYDTDEMWSAEFDGEIRIPEGALERLALFTFND